MKFKAFTIAVLYSLLLNNGVQAQQFNISWIDNSKMTGDYEDGILLNDGNYIANKFARSKQWTRGVVIPIMTLGGPDMTPIKDSTWEIGERWPEDCTLRKYGTNVFFTYSAYDNKNTTAYAIKVNQQTMMPGAKIILGIFDSDGTANQANITYKLSPDSTKVLLFAEGPERKKENKQFYIGVFDTTLKKIWSRYIELPFGDALISIYDLDIADDGKVYVTIKHYDKEVSRQDVSENTEKIPAFSYKLLAYTREGRPKEIAINLKDHFIHGAKLVYNRNGTITAAGLYKKKPNGNITGAFYTAFDTSATVVNDTKMVSFPPEILKLVDKDDQAKSGGSDPGLRSFFRINHIIPRTNGTIDLISEACRADLATKDIGASVRGTSSREIWNYDYEDIININLDKQGNAIFTRIPKVQEGNTGAPYSYYPVVYKDKLILVYNDHEDNMTRDLSKAPEHVARAKDMVLVAATIDAKGNLSRQGIYNFRDKQRMALPKKFSRISDNKYLVVSALASFLSTEAGFGLLELK
jgi:hypothetical protein